MKKLLFYILISCGFITFSQEEASNWYFGENAGIQFANDGTVTALNDGQLNTIEGCSSISDDNGDLLFYTDGITVFNRQHNMLSNGFGLLGDPSSSQSAIVVPKPLDPDIYYIFTVGSNASQTGLKYSVVDMTRDGGLGQITQKNINLLNQCSEKISAVLKDCATQTIWVITLSNPNGSSTTSLDTFHAFEVTTAGVNSTSVTSTFNNLGITDSRGYLKLSPSGDKLACANIQNGLFLFDFDKDTGIVSNDLRLNINSPYNKPYGIEFSPNSQLLYVTSSNDNFGPGDTNPNNHSSSLTQFDISATNIVASQVLIDQQNLYRSAIQLGPNGKIYRSMAATYTQGYPFLSVINNPNQIGTACNYENNAINLRNNNSTQGLPPFISSFFAQKIDIIQNYINPISENYLPLCYGETYTLAAQDVPGAIYSWYFNESLISNTHYFLEISQAGLYEVFIDLNNGGCEFLEGEALVEYFPIPVANIAPDLEACDENENEIMPFDLTTHNNTILGNQDSNRYSVHYFESQTDADLYQNEIIGLYENTSNPQEIFARVDLTGSPNCYSMTSFLIIVNPLPDLEEDELTFYCLNTHPQTIPLSAGIINDSPSNYTYLWSTGETTETIQINHIGTYTVTATNIHGCSKSRNITVEPSNIATFNDIIVVDASDNNTITVLVSGEGEYEYALYDQDGLYTTFQSSNIFYNVYGGIYTVAVRDIKNNCGIVTQNISVVDYPKFFTPNGDGYNDTWNIKGNSNLFQPNTLIRIYNRYGKLVKQINPLGTGWDGTFNGELLPNSDYWFSATLQDGRVLQSHFTLKR